jgi:hypothetical protein
MSLALFKVQDPSVTLLENSWKSSIDPVLACPLVSGVLQKNIALTAGLNSVNTMLGRTLQGYLITGMHGAYSEIYDVTSLNPSLTLSLHSSVATTIDLYCF